MDERTIGRAGCVCIHICAYRGARSFALTILYVIMLFHSILDWYACIWICAFAVSKATSHALLLLIFGILSSSLSFSPSVRLYLFLLHLSSEYVLVFTIPFCFFSMLFYSHSKNHCIDKLATLYGIIICGRSKVKELFMKCIRRTAINPVAHIH